MFGREKRLAKIDAKYISGHPLYAHEKGTDVLFYVDRMKFDNMDITIPYGAIIRLGAQEDRHITKTRVLFTGAIGLFWKKKYRYTVIEYNDGIQDQTVILDFHKEANKAQRIIYNQMAGGRLKQADESEQQALTESEQVGVSQNRTFCRFCGKSISTLGDYCPMCGKSIGYNPNQSKECKNCDVRLSEDSEYCAKCGTKL